MDHVTLGKLLTQRHTEDKPITANQKACQSASQSSSSVVFDGSGKPDGERNVDQSVGFGATRNTYSAHSKFSENTQTEKMVDGSGKPDERDSSNAQIWTLLEEQRQMIIAEYRDKVGHNELQAAHAEEERRLLQGHLWRQKLEFRGARQQSLTEMEELRKFQSSTFDTIARRKLIEDQNTILELSGRLQELQNEVNCMNDSKDFQDAESVRSGNSHVTSRPVSFPPHPIPEGLLRHSFVTPPKISLRHDHDWTTGNDELGSTVEQQPVGKLVQQSCGEVQHAKFSKPTQPKPKPICDRSGKPENTEDVFVVKGETSRSHEIDGKGLQEELGSSDRSGKPDKLSENIRVQRAHDGTGQPVEQSSSSAHTVKEQHAPDERREIASFNTNNEFNRAINE